MQLLHNLKPETTLTKRLGRPVKRTSEVFEPSERKIRGLGIKRKLNSLLKPFGVKPKFDYEVACGTLMANIPPHTDDISSRVSLFWLVKGEVLFRCGSKKRVMRSGDMVVFNHHRQHEVVNLNGTLWSFIACSLEDF